MGIFDKPPSPPEPKYPCRIKKAQDRAARRAAYLTRPRKVQHVWSPKKSRPKTRPPKVMAAIEQAHRALVTRWQLAHPGQQMPDTKFRSLWANAVCKVTYLDTPRRQSDNQRMRSHMANRAKATYKRARAEAAQLVPQPPPPAKRSSWRLPGI